MNSTEFTTIRISDGRRLAYAEFGDPLGVPLIYLHGFPSSRLEAKLLDESAKRFELQVIAPDRNGIGMSDQYPGRSLLDWPKDIEAMADVMGVERFHLVGVSGGGPYALACAHQLTDRLQTVTVVCPLGPLDQVSLLRAMRWPSRMGLAMMHDVLWLPKRLFQHSFNLLVKYQSNLAYQMLCAMADPSEKQVLSRTEVRQTITRSIRESVRKGSDGLLQELDLFHAPWDFDLKDIRQPVQLWHGTKDSIVPMLHGQWIAERLPNCDAHYLPGEGHYSLPINHMDEILHCLVTDSVF